MGFDIDRLIRQSEVSADARTRVSLIDDDCGSYSRSSFKAPEFQSRNSGGLNGIIIAALDRDSDLRRDYLRKVRQGITRKAS